MDYYKRLVDNVKYYYEQINPATLSGAIDVIVVQQPNGDLLSTPFHVRFGKYGVFNYKEKFVDVAINGVESKALRMKLSENGIAYFVEETEDESVPDYLLASPVSGTAAPSIDKVLAETSRTLEQHLSKEIDMKKKPSPDSTGAAAGYSSTSTKATSKSKAIDIGAGRSRSPASPPPTDGSSIIATSPTTSLRRSKSMVRGGIGSEEKKDSVLQHYDDEHVVQKRKMTLPFSFSVFSARRYRSLPNLLSLHGQEEGDEQAKEQQQQQGQTPSSARTVEKASAEKVGSMMAASVASAVDFVGLKDYESSKKEKDSGKGKTGNGKQQRRIPRLRTTKSAVLERRERRDSSSSTLSSESATSTDSGSMTPPPTRDGANSAASALAGTGTPSKVTPQKTPPSRKDSKVMTAAGPVTSTSTNAKSSPIAIQILREDSHDSSASSSTSSPIGLDQQDNKLESASAVRRLNDGALSDTEMEMHRRELPGDAASEVSVWNWGQMPKTRAEEKKETKTSSGTWWPKWAWGGGVAEGGPSTSGGAAAAGATASPGSSPLSGGGEAKDGKAAGSGNKSAGIEERQDEGITLEDLLTGPMDQDKMQKYIGKPTSYTSTDADSGNGSGLNTQPASPGSVHSVSLHHEEDRTPTQESVASALEAAANADKTPTRKSATVANVTELAGRRTVEATPRKQRANSEIFAMSEEEDVTQDDELYTEPGTTKKYIRTLRLTSDKLKMLGLNYGANECRFSITTKFQGTTWCACNIYLYKYSEKIVISDIDGTITKSDVLGHVIPAIGGQWAHTGVAELYTRIKANGYKMLYLSSRAIGQAATTKNYLRTVQQEQRVLPDGPVLLAPDSVLVAFRREVIERRPEEFKIAALSDVKKLFPKNPFFAGFGNRDTDVKSYRAVEIDGSRILIIDPSGTVKRADGMDNFRSSYKCMAQDSVDCIFPPVLDERAREKPQLTRLLFSKPQTASAYTYWNSGSSPPSGALEDDELAKYEAARKQAQSTKKKRK